MSHLSEEPQSFLQHVVLGATFRVDLVIATHISNNNNSIDVDKTLEPFVPIASLSRHSQNVELGLLKLDNCTVEDNVYYK